MRHFPPLNLVIPVTWRQLFPIERRQMSLVPPAKPVITIPIPVQRRAVKRQQRLKNILAESDREKLKDKPVIIQAARRGFDHRLSQTYGKFDNVPLVSESFPHLVSSAANCSASLIVLASCSSDKRF